MTSKSNLHKPLMTAIIFLLIASPLIDQNTKANFIPLPQEPPTEKPEIILTTPFQNQSILTKNELNLTFTIKIPNSWNDYLGPYYTPINESIQNITVFTSWKNNYSLNRTENQTYSLNLQNIPKGNNTISINVNATVLYRLPSTGPFDQDEINFNANTTINFTVEDPESLPEMQFYIITTLIVVFVGAGILTSIRTASGYVSGGFPV